MFHYVNDVPNNSSWDCSSLSQKNTFCTASFHFIPDIIIESCEYAIQYALSYAASPHSLVGSEEKIGDYVVTIQTENLTHL